MIERLSRRIHQRNRYVVNQIAPEEWRRLISLANVLYCENPSKLESEWIREYHLCNGDFDILDVDPKRKVTPECPHTHSSHTRAHSL